MAATALADFYARLLEQLARRIRERFELDVRRLARGGVDLDLARRDREIQNERSRRLVGLRQHRRVPSSDDLVTGVLRVAEDLLAKRADRPAAPLERPHEGGLLVAADDPERRAAVDGDWKRNARHGGSFQLW